MLRKSLEKKIEIVHASSEAEIDAAFDDTLRGARANALLVRPDAFLINKRIVALAARDVLPAMYQTRELVAAGAVDELRIEFCRHVPPDGRLCRQGSQGRKPGRAAGVAACQDLRYGNQSANRQGAWSETLRQFAVACRRERLNSCYLLRCGSLKVADFVAEVGCEGEMGRCGPDFAASRLPLRCQRAAQPLHQLTRRQQQGAVQVTLRRSTQPGF